MLGLLICTVTVLVIIVLILVVRAAARRVRAERARRDHLRAWAAANDWEFVEFGHAPWTARLPGRNSGALGVTLTGAVDRRQVTVAEYSYTRLRPTGTRDFQTHRFIVVAVLLDHRLPQVAVTARGALSWAGLATFGRNATATGNRRFDAQFEVTAADPEHAESLIGRPLIAAHLDGTVPLWNVDGDVLLSCIPVSNKLASPDSVLRHAQRLVRVADLLGRDPLARK